MTDVEEHYESLLAEVYDWMQGGWSAKTDASRKLLEQHQLRGPGTAVDLGAGTGYQAIPLAEAGFDVLAIDISDSMLRQLKRRAGELSVRVERGDLRNFGELLERSADVIVCMGDTLSHLPDHAAATGLVSTASADLAEHGRLVLQFRDLSRLPSANARFLPIRSSDDRVFTCFLEEISDEHVRVHDILHVHSNGKFEQRISSYTKTRLDEGWLDRALTDAGLTTIAKSTERGLITCVAAAR